MASAWITILTVTWAGVIVIDLATGFLFASQRTTENGWVGPGAPSESISTSTTAWMPVSWLFGPSTLTLGGVTVVAVACSWNPGGNDLTRSIETPRGAGPFSSIDTVTQGGA